MNNDYTYDLAIIAESLKNVPVSFLWGCLDVVEAEILSRKFYEDFPEGKESVKVEMNKTRPVLSIVRGDKV